jgi:hypothetical protein
MATATELEERLRVWALAQAGLSDPEMADRLGWKRVKMRKWRRRAQASNGASGPGVAHGPSSQRRIE